MVSRVPPELMDNDYNYIMFEFNMNYSIESVRNGYIKGKKAKSERVSDDILLRLGYTDKDLLNRRD